MSSEEIKGVHSASAQPVKVVGDSTEISKAELQELLAAKTQLGELKAKAAAERSDVAISGDDIPRMLAGGAKFEAAPQKLIFTSIDAKAAAELSKQLDLDPKSYTKFADAATAIDFKSLRRELADTKLQSLIAMFVPAMPVLGLWNIFKPVQQLQKIQAVRETREAITSAKFIEMEGGKAMLRSELEAVSAKDDMRTALIDRIAQLESKMQTEPAGLITAAMLRAYLKDISPMAMMPKSIKTGHSYKNAALMDLDALKGAGEAHLKAKFNDAKFWERINTEMINFILATMLTVYQAKDATTKDRVSSTYEQFGRVNSAAADLRKATKEHGTLMKWAIEARIWLSGFTNKPEFKELEVTAKKHAKEFAQIIKTQNDVGQKNLTTRLTDLVTKGSGELLGSVRKAVGEVGIGDKLKLASGLNRVVDTALGGARKGLDRAEEKLKDPGFVAKSLERALKAANPLGIGA